MQENKNITSYRMSLRERILEVAMKSFSAKGIKAVKMDDIAQALTISKRTLYEIFENKEVLLFEGVRKYRHIKEQSYEKLVAEAANVMDVILKIYKLEVENVRHVNPLFYAEIERYPQVLEFLDSEKKTRHQRFVDFVRRGIDEGYFRNDVDVELCSLLFNALSQYVMSAQLYNTYSMEEIMHSMVFIALRGFCTQKGITVLDQFLGIQS